MTDTTRVSRDDQHREVICNFHAFRQKLPKLMLTDEGRISVWRDMQLVTIKDTNTEAFNFAHEAFPDGRWSIQPINDHVHHFTRAIP